MDNVLKRLLSLSEQFSAEVATASLDDLQEFLQQRDALIIDLQRLEEEQEFHLRMSSDVRLRLRRLARDICGYDEAILSRMLLLQREAADGLARFDQSRQQKTAYETLYSMESAFIDQRK